MICFNKNLWSCSLFPYNIFGHVTRLSRIFHHVTYFSELFGHVTCFSLDAASAVSRELARLVKIPIDSYNNVLELLKLDHYGPLMEYFDYQARKSISTHLILNALENETIIPSPEQVGKLLPLLICIGVGIGYGISVTRLLRK